MDNIRCSRCRAMLFRAEPGALTGALEIKCRRCGEINSLSPKSPIRAPQRPLQRHRSHGQKTPSPANSGGV